MTITTYQDLAKRTDTNIGNAMANSIHMVLGMHSEFNELSYALRKNDWPNVKEELGDIMWYATNYCTQNSINIITVFGVIPLLTAGNIDKEAVLIQLSNATSLLQNTWKRKLAYKKDVVENDHLIIKDVFHCVSLLCKKYAFSMPEILDRNINKLNVRFPDKFTEKDALNRNLDEERKTLE